MGTGAGRQGGAGTWRTRWVDVRGPVHCAVAEPPDGSRPGRPTAVLVHGLSGAHANWSTVAPHLLAAGYRLVAPDLPGHGLTPPAGRDTRLPALADLLAEVVRRVADGPVLLVGNSLGGLLAVEHAARHPDTVRLLALLAPVAPLGRGRPHPLTLLGFAAYSVPLLGEAVMGGRRRLPPRRQVEASLWMTCADPTRVSREVVDEHVAVLRRRAGHTGLERAFLATARSVVRRVVRPAVMRRALDDVRCPVLLVQGDADRLVPVGASRAAAAAHPDWTYVELPGTGHVPQLERPDEVADVLLRWWDRHLG
ncbi:alpha/beta fold hydrolase [Thalassiella azotivora]